MIKIKCPHCNRDIFETSVICPYCRTQVGEVIPEKVFYDPFKKSEPPKEIEDVKPNKKKKWLLLGAIVLFIILLGSALFLTVKIMQDKDKKVNEETTSSTSSTEATEYISIPTNKGVPSSISYPVRIGKTSLASINIQNDESLLVDVTGIKFLSNDEASALAQEQNLKLPHSDFLWEGLVYRVEPHILPERAQIDPRLELGFYQLDSKYFIEYENHNYTVEFTTIYDGKNIGNEQEATVTVLYYRAPTSKDYSICIGLADNTKACFSKFAK